MSDPTKTSQTADILRYLRAGESLTALQALDMFKCFRLAARIDDAKKRLEPNEQIIRHWVKTAGGARVARYSLKTVTMPKNS